MARYAIGDIQGCMASLDRLLGLIDFRSQVDQLWLVGDLVNRGPRSLDVRRQTSREKLDCLRAMGVELVLVDGALPPNHPESYNRKAKQVVAQTPRAYFTDQHNNRGAQTRPS